MKEFLMNNETINITFFTNNLFLKENQFIFYILTINTFTSLNM